MKKIILILKLLVVAALLFLNICYVIYNVTLSDTALNFLIGQSNYVNIISDSNVHTAKENKMSLLYFYKEEDLETYKFDTLKTFVENTECAEIVNFVPIKLESDKETVFQSALRVSGSNAVVLLNKTGYKLFSANSDVSIVEIEKELKEILINYI